MKSIDTSAASTLVLLFAAASSSFAQVHTELIDAGDLLPTAQAVVGVGPVAAILGRLDTAGDANGDRDLFRIAIDAGGGFSATVTSTTPADDTKLYLFDRHGLGILADDDSGPGVHSSLPLGHPSLANLPSGQYYLAITDFDYLPVSDGGVIFGSGNLALPNGPGAGQPLSGWTLDTNEFTYDYTIELTGASFVPEPSLLALLAVGAMTPLALRCRVGVYGRRTA